MKTHCLSLVVFSLLSALAVSRLPAAEEPAAAPSPAPGLGVEECLKRLDSEDEKVRNEAKIALAKLGPAIAPRLIKELSSAPAPKAYDLVLVLDYLKSAEAAEAYAKLFDASQDIKIKLVTAMALARLDRDYQARQDFIVSRTKEGSEDDRQQAMQMLGYLKDARAVSVLKSIFYDPAQSDGIRQAAIWDLGHTPVPESAQVLVEISQDPEVDWFYKEIVFAALKLQAGDKEMAEVINRLLEKAQRLPASAPVSPTAVR
jgi:HEAT repeat protein